MSETPCQVSQPGSPVAVQQASAIGSWLATGSQCFLHTRPRWRRRGLALAAPGSPLALQTTTPMTATGGAPALGRTFAPTTPTPPSTMLSCTSGPTSK